MASIPTSITEWTKLCKRHGIGSESFRDLNNDRLQNNKSLVSGSTFSEKEWCFLRSIWVNLDLETEIPLAALGVIKRTDDLVNKVNKLMGTHRPSRPVAFQSHPQRSGGPSNPPSGPPQTPQGRNPPPQAGLAHRPKRARADEDPKQTCRMSAFWTCVELMQKHADDEDFTVAHENPPAVLQTFLLVFQEYKAIMNRPAAASNSPPKFSLTQDRRHGTPEDLDDEDILFLPDSSPLAGKGKGKGSAAPTPALIQREGGMSSNDAGGDDDVHLKTRSEQFVASFLFMFIGCIASYAKYDEDWYRAKEKSLVSHAHQVAFRVGEPRVRNDKKRSARGFTTCIDGLFAKEQDYEAKDYLAIYEVKAPARSEIPEVYMQETAEFVGWISELAKDPKFKPRPLMMVCQDKDVIHVNVAIFGEGYLRYIRNHDEKVLPSGLQPDDMLKIHHSRPLVLSMIDDMTIFARIILFLGLS